MAGMIEVDGDSIAVVDLEKLAMSARNLACVTDDQGGSLPPSQWSRRPEVPEYLLATQEPLEVSRLQTIAANESNN